RYRCARGCGAPPRGISGQRPGHLITCRSLARKRHRPGKEKAMAEILGGQTAIVTGASSGIGAATARELAHRGARVVLAARRVIELEAQAGAINEAGGQALAVPTDVTDAGQVMRLVERTQQRFGPIGVLVNSAGTN